MQDHSESPGPYRWVIIGSLTASTAAHLIVIYIIGLLLPDISEDLDLSPSEQGWLGSSVLLANLLLCIPMNTLLSRYRPWRVVALLSLGVGLFGLLQGWSPILAALLIGRVAAGLCFTATMAPRSLLIQQWTPRHQLPITNGVWVGGVDLFMGIAFFVTPLILKWPGGWHSVYYFWAGVSLLLAAFWMVFGRERVTPDYREKMGSQEKTPLHAILKYPELWILAVGMIGAMMGSTGFQTFWPTLAEEKLGISTSLIGITLGLNAIAAAPAGFLVNAVPTLVRKQPMVLALGGILTTTVYIGLMYADSPPAVLALGAAEGVTRAYFPVLMTMVYQMPNIRPREVAVGLAFMETCIWAGGAVGPVVVGSLQEATGDLRFGILVVSFAPLTLVVASVLLLARRWSPVPQIPIPTASTPKS